MNFVVDTGAQSTVITSKVAEAASLRRVINEAIQPMLLGVGVSTTDGALNAFDVCIEGEYFATSAMGRKIERGMRGSDAWRDGAKRLSAWIGLFEEVQSGDRYREGRIDAATGWKGD